MANDSEDLGYPLQVLTSDHLKSETTSIAKSAEKSEPQKSSSITGAGYEDLEDRSRVPEDQPELKNSYFFGCGPCHPKWLQIFSNKKFFTLILCLSALLQGAVVAGKFSTTNVCDIIYIYRYITTNQNQ